MKRASILAAGAALALLGSGPAFAACGGLMNCGGGGGGSASLPRANVGGTPSIAVMPRGGAGANPGLMPRNGAGIISRDGAGIVAQGAGNFGPGRR